MNSSVDVDTSDSKSLAIMGILSTMETICTVMEDHLEVCSVLSSILYLFFLDVLR